MNDTSAMGAIYIALFSIITLAVAAGATALSLHLWNLAKNSTTARVLARAWDIACSVVAQMEVQLKPTLQGALKDGQLTPDEIKQIQSEAVAAFKKSLGESGLKELKTALSIETPGLDGWIVGFVERAFQFFKLSSSTPVVVGSPISPAPKPLLPANP